jgi:hypothetical protein
MNWFVFVGVQMPNCYPGVETKHDLSDIKPNVINLVNCAALLCNLGHLIYSF